MANRVKDLQVQWAACAATDGQKQAVVKGLFEQIQALRSELDDTERELLDKKDALQQIRGRESDAKERIKDLERQRDRHIFAAVLIDGDNMPFKDDLVKQGFDGGRRTASLLKTEVNSHLEQFVPEASKQMINIVIHVFANTKGLGRKYKELNLLPESSTFEDFMRGFNMGDPLCHYTDAGDGKECADVKVQAMFEFYRHHVHCRQTFLCAPCDNGYARVLMPHLEDKALCERITLVRGARFAAELQKLHDNFRVTSFDNVFRRDTLPSFDTRASLRVTPPTSPDQAYAAVAARVTDSSTQSPTMPGPWTSTSSAAVDKNGKPLVERNSQGYRLDKQLHYSINDYKTLKPMKLCNYFHILDKCPYNEKTIKCQYEHGQKLPMHRVSALMAIARASPCPMGVRCGAPDCIFGHRCVRAGHCDRNSCWFGEEMHHMNTTVATA